MVGAICVTGGPDGRSWPRSLDLISSSELDHQLVDDVAVIFEWVPISVPSRSNQLPETRSSDDDCHNNGGHDNSASPRGRNQPREQHVPTASRKLGGVVKMAGSGGVPRSHHKHIAGVSDYSRPTRGHDNPRPYMPSLKNVGVVQTSRIVEHGEVREEEPARYTVNATTHELRKQRQPSRWKSEFEYGESDPPNAGTSKGPRRQQPEPRLGRVETRKGEAEGFRRCETDCRLCDAGGYNPVAERENQSPSQILGYCSRNGDPVGENSQFRPTHKSEVVRPLVEWICQTQVAQTHECCKLPMMKSLLENQTDTQTKMFSNTVRPSPRLEAKVRTNWCNLLPARLPCVRGMHDGGAEAHFLPQRKDPPWSADQCRASLPSWYFPCCFSDELNFLSDCDGKVDRCHGFPWNLKPFRRNGHVFSPVAILLILQVLPVEYWCISGNEASAARRGYPAKRTSLHYMSTAAGAPSCGENQFQVSDDVYYYFATHYNYYSEDTFYRFQVPQNPAAHPSCGPSPSATPTQLKLYHNEPIHYYQEKRKPWYVQAQRWWYVQACSHVAISIKSRGDRRAGVWKWYRAVRVGQAAVPGPRAQNISPAVTLEEAAASLERWARRHGWTAPEEESPPSNAFEPAEVIERESAREVEAAHQEDEESKQETLKRIQNLEIGHLVVATPSPARQRHRTRAPGARSPRGRGGDASVSAKTSQGEKVKEGRFKGKGKEKEEEGKGKDKVPETHSNESVRDGSPAHRTSQRTTPGRKGHANNVERKAKNSCKKPKQIEDDPENAKNPRAKPSAKVGPASPASPSQPCEPRGNKQAGKVVPADGNSQAKVQSAAQSSSENWRGADPGQGAGSTQSVAAIESQESREFSMSRRGKSRRKRGVIYCPADWAKRRVTQPRRCKACQRVVTKGSFGEICRTCGDFVCSVPCRKSIQANGGCECLAGPSNSPSNQLQSSTPPPPPQAEVTTTLPGKQFGQHLAAPREGGLEKSRVQIRATEIVQDDFSIFERAACICREIVQIPAPPLWQRVPPQLERRILELLRDAIVAHADSEIYAARTGTNEAAERAYVQGTFLHTLYAALMYKPQEYPATSSRNTEHEESLELGPLKEDELETNMRVVHIIKARIAVAELGQWDKLLQGLLDEQHNGAIADKAAFRSRQAEGGNDEEKRQQKAILKMQSGDIVGAKQALKAQATIPGGPALIKQLTDLIAEPIDAQEQQAYAAAVDAARRIVPSYVCKPSARELKARLKVINCHATPGPSGMTNVLLSKLWKVRGGMGALQRWIGAWNSGRICQRSTDLWTAAKLVALDCGEKADAQTGRKLRPLGLAEALTKLAESCAIQREMKRLHQVLEPGNLGIVTSGGALVLQNMLECWASDLELYNRNQLAQGCFDELYGIEAADLSNAYGTFTRSSAIESTIAAIPGLAGTLVASEQALGTRYQIQSEGEWQTIVACRGGAQGRRITTILFAFWLQNTHKGVLKHQQGAVAAPAYQDDTYRVGLISDLAASWPEWKARVEEGGGKFNASKSMVWIPGADEAAAVMAAALTNSYELPVVTDGLSVLGGVVQDQFKSAVGNFQRQIETAAKRLREATEFAERIVALANSALEFASHTAFVLAAKSLREALSFDAAILPPQAGEELYDQLDKIVRHTIEATTGGGGDALTWVRTQLPGPLGGTAIRTTALRAPAAYLANQVTNGPRAAALAEAMGKPTVCPNAMRAAMEFCKQQLGQIGVVVASRDIVTFQPAMKAILAASPWAKHIPTAYYNQPMEGRGMLSAIMVRVELAMAALHLVPDLDTHVAAQWLSAGGEGVGKTWTEVPRPGALIDNTHWIVMSKMRLGTMAVADGMACQCCRSENGPNPTSEVDFTEPKCLERLTNPVTHPLLCRVGKSRLKPHRMVARSFCRLFESLNVYADEERAIPSLYQLEENGRIKEAVLDAVLSFPGETGLVPFDVTIRCPHGEDEGIAATRPGHAAKSGCLDKDERYGTNCVVPLSYETYGRLDERSCAELRAVCAAAARCNNASTAAGTNKLTGAEAYNKVRRGLERTLLWEQADTMIRSIGHTAASGPNARRGGDREKKKNGPKCLFPIKAVGQSPDLLYLRHTGSSVDVHDGNAIESATAVAKYLSVNLDDAPPTPPAPTEATGAVSPAGQPNNVECLFAQNFNVDDSYRNIHHNHPVPSPHPDIHHNHPPEADAGVQLSGTIDVGGSADVTPQLQVATVQNEVRAAAETGSRVVQPNNVECMFSKILTLTTPTGTFITTTLLLLLLSLPTQTFTITTRQQLMLGHSPVAPMMVEVAPE